jgi:hypothetical protein
LIEQINFTDKSFDIKNINDYHLSLQVYVKGFSFCILDRERNKFIAISNYYFDKINSYNILLEEINNIYNTNEILQLQFKHIKLLFTTNKYTNIPSAFYDEKEIESIYSFNQNLDKNESLLTNYTYGNSAYTIFGIPNSIKTFFTEKHNNINIYHNTTPLIEEILLKEKLNSNHNKVFLNIMPNTFDIVIIEKNNLKLLNTFTYNSDTDFIYYILNIFNQLGLSPIDIPISITGFIRKNDSKIEKLKKYIKHINFFNKPTHFDYSYEFNSIPNHYFSNLINLYQCG